MFVRGLEDAQCEVRATRLQALGATAIFSLLYNRAVARALLGIGQAGEAAPVVTRPIIQLVVAHPVASREALRRAQSQHILTNPGNAPRGRAGPAQRRRPRVAQPTMHAPARALDTTLNITRLP